MRRPTQLCRIDGPNRRPSTYPSVSPARHPAVVPAGRTTASPGTKSPTSGEVSVGPSPLKASFCLIVPLTAATN
ncbi:hypothetical protein HNR40_007816 [Nonomuraea endophytica]|uniref:Uncharacterized protein n=1 Tax=Nonomuraea endophytica TaxID=714136 RepID=A0A7W8A9V7_9ACTN|nr:hypothetical protein [Nonomuraea endophytica]